MPDIRTAVPSDAAAIAALSAQLGYPVDAATVTSGLATMAASSNNQVFVAVTAEGQVIGWAQVVVALRLASGSFAELGGLVVAKTHRRRGVGRALTERAEQWVQARGLGRLRVRTRQERADAQSFYETCGYERVKMQQVFDKSLAPLGIKSRIRRGSEKPDRRRREVHFANLEKMYLSAPCNEYYDPSIKIAEGTAEIAIPVREEFFHAAGAVHGSVYFKALDDAAFFAVNSVVQDVFVLTTNLNTYLSRPICEGLMLARGRLVSHSGKQFLAESALVDAKGREIGRAHGTFVRSRIKLSAKLGYG